MTYTPTHNSCTASVMLCIRALPQACLLYSDACVSVIVNADKHALIILYALSQDTILLLMMLTCMCMQAELKLCRTVWYNRTSIHTLK